MKIGAVARTTLMSSLVYPGLGQWMLGRRGRGAALMAAATALALWFSFAVAWAANQAMFPPVEEMVLPEWSQAPGILLRSLKAGIGPLLPLAGVWIGGAIDAYLLARKSERRAGPPLAPPPLASPPD